MGVGLPMSETRGNVDFEDGKIRIDPNGFNGSLNIDSVGITVGPVGLSRTNIYVGDAVSTSADGRGLDVGISIGIGGSAKTVNQVIYRKCGCNTGTKPMEHSFGR